MVENTGKDTDQQNPLVDELGIAQLDNILPVGEYEEDESVDGHTVKRKGIYILPNLFTTAALFSGFYAVINAMNGEFEKAAMAIFVAMIFDICDGFVARLMNAQSAFGAQYDSLSDMVSFGVAPALCMYNFALKPFGKIGWAVAFIYVACAALRLARFNAQVGKADKRFFTGLASPAAATIVASIIWLNTDLGWIGEELPRFMAIFAAIITVFVGLLMVSNVKYRSFKGLDFKGRVPLTFMILLMVFFAIVTIDPPKVFLTLLTIYAISGPLTNLGKS